MRELEIFTKFHREKIQEQKSRLKNKENKVLLVNVRSPQWVTNVLITLDKIFRTIHVTEKIISPGCLDLVSLSQVKSVFCLNTLFKEL